MDRRSRAAASWISRRIGSFDGGVAGQGGAAEVLGLKRTTLLSKMKKFGITRSSKLMSA
jgi:hypothetical protein